MAKTERSHLHWSISGHEVVILCGLARSLVIFIYTLCKDISQLKSVDVKIQENRVIFLHIYILLLEKGALCVPVSRLDLLTWQLNVHVSVGHA